MIFSTASLFISFPLWNILPHECSSNSFVNTFKIALEHSIQKNLQKDYVFEKLRFKHSEKLSKNVFDMMEGGEKVYPHEGLKEADFIINRIRVGTLFSEEAFQYALYRSHEYALADGERCREDLSGFRIDGQPIKIVPSHPYKISSARKKRIDNKYADFS